MHRTVRLETNHAGVIELARNFFHAHRRGPITEPIFRWRLICESDARFGSASAALFSAFSDSGLRYVSIGNRGFMAIDLENREAAAYFSDRFLEADAKFQYRPPLDTLFCMTAASLGLTTLSAGCVSRENRGIVVLGAPNSGKTTASYLAAKKHGLEFHADQVVFLDCDNQAIRVWGDTLPAVFRPETVNFLPELRGTTRLSTYSEHSFLYFDKSSMQPLCAHAISPVCSVFLDRSASQKKLRRISPEQAALLFHSSLLFQEDVRFDSLVTATLKALAEKPVYELKYPSDPDIAADVIEELLQ